MAGTITLSFELELGWGQHAEGEYSHLSENRRRETTALWRLLDFADQYKLPITFDVVGHLLHESCRGSHDGPHPKDWWLEDPGTDTDTDPLFYAPELVSEIQNREVGHEIATHTYSHLLADESGPEVLNYELTRVREVYEEFGIPAPTSIVMPRHHSPDYSVLKDHGIQIIRAPIDGYSRSFQNPLSKTWWLLTRDHPISTLESVNGILKTTATPHPSLTSVTLPTGQSPPHPVFSILPTRLRQSLHQRYLTKAIDKAGEEDAHLHFWTHVYNMANDEQWRPLRAALRYLVNQRDKGQVLIRRMNDLDLPTQSA